MARRTHKQGSQHIVPPVPASSCKSVCAPIRCSIRNVSACSVGFPVTGIRAHLAKSGPFFHKWVVRPELLQPLGDDVKQGLDLNLLIQKRGETVLQTVTARVRQAVRRRRGGCTGLCGHGDRASDDTASGRKTRYYMSETTIIHMASSLRPAGSYCGCAKVSSFLNLTLGAQQIICACYSPSRYTTRACVRGSPWLYGKQGVLVRPDAGDSDMAR